LDYFDNDRFDLDGAVKTAGGFGSGMILKATTKEREFGM
jgi:hypothetical protein